MTHLSTDLVLGVNALNHDASLALISTGDVDEIVFAAHAERYSRVKNDPLLNHAIVADLLKYGKPSAIYCQDRPVLKALRRLYSGERPLFDPIKQHLRNMGLGNLPVIHTHHHRAHAAMGYQTSPYDHAVILVIDAIGEWDCVSVWVGQGTSLTLKKTIKYPHSLGLFYSAITQAVGLKPNEEEYILMGMAAYGDPHKHFQEITTDFFEVFDPPRLVLKQNLHRGMGDYLEKKGWAAQDVAATAQQIVENYMLKLAHWAQITYSSKNLILTGGVALNCVANSKISDHRLYENIWVPPNPGDAGLSIGVVAAHRNKRLRLCNAFLGHDIAQPLDIKAVVEQLVKGEIVGIANGRAEFGPRALGNRSLLADPRGSDVKLKVNAIKKRQEFRPFAPAILQEHAKDYFTTVLHDQNYMQWTNNCRYPDQFPAVCHVDGSSRAQTVPSNGSNIRKILDLWYAETGCPMLLNTSLNVKGEPLVNTWADAERFSKLYGIRIF
jgi:carbamoyltransferase